MHVRISLPLVLVVGAMGSRVSRVLEEGSEAKFEAIHFLL